jgi:hypothetical protein
MTDALKAAEARYPKAFDAFLSEAREHQHMSALVDALTGTLARPRKSAQSNATGGRVTTP